MNQYEGIIKPENIQYVNNLVDATIADVSTAGEAVEKAYGERASLVKIIKQLEGSIKLEEATAFMQIGADNTVDIEGKKVKLSNGEMRDMYRRYVSRDLRKQLTEKEADLAEIESKIMLAKDRWDEAKTTANLVEARSWAQGNLLKFLSNKA
jgi:DNA gyrase/topoisomerase IV subunit B